MALPRQRAHSLFVFGAIITLIASIGAVFTPAQASTPSTYAWGDNSTGQLGNGTTTDSTTPTTVSMPAGVTFTSITASQLYTCALTTTGDAYCWGQNSHGELGNGTTTDSTTPTAVTGGLTFTSITSGSAHTCALTTSGVAYCWGYNFHGELGNGLAPAPSATPSAVTMPVGVTFTSITAGQLNTCALTTTGAAYCWGYNITGQLGNGTTTASTTPTAVTMPTGVTFISITAGYQHTCALTTTGAAYCWGYNINGELGNGSAPAPSATPSAVTMPTGVTFTSITAGAANMCALSTTGAAYCWGYNVTGQLGNGSAPAPSATPSAVTMPTGVTFTSITSGQLHTCTLTTTGAAYCWGYNNDGQLGNGTTTDSTTPTTVSGGLVFATVVTGSSSSSTFGILLTRASGNNVPTAPLQQFGRPEAGTCERQPADLLDFPGVSHLNGQSWGPSWAQWPNGGTGGFVCNRQPYYTNTGSWAVE